jgi:hypothetical protein
MYLLATNLLASLTVAPAPSSAGDVARLSDGDPGPQYVGAVGAITLDVDLGATPPAVSSWGLLHHNITGVTMVLASGAAFPPATTRDSVDPAGADLHRRFATVTARYWRWSIPALAGSVAPLLGELLLGTAISVPDKPTIPSGWPAMVGNVIHDRSPAGIPWATRRGPARARLSLEWAGIPEADLVALLAAYTATGEGERPLLVEDAQGVVRWMTWTDPELAPEVIKPGLTPAERLFHVRSTFEEFPI